MPITVALLQQGYDPRCLPTDGGAHIVRHKSSDDSSKILSSPKTVRERLSWSEAWGRRSHESREC